MGEVSQRARELLAAEYADEPADYLDHVQHVGVYKALRAIDKAYEAGRVNEREANRQAERDAEAEAIEQGEHSPDPTAEGVKE